MTKVHKLVLALLFVVFIPVTVLAAALPAAGPPPSATATGTVTGRLLATTGEPLSGGMVYFFSEALGPPPSQDKYMRVPDFMEALDGEGRFSVTLPAGTYYMGGTKRLSGKPVGPPQDGDWFFLHADDKGAPRSFGLAPGGRVEFGSIAKAVPFKKSVFTNATGVTAIEGVILDGDGKPVEDALVFAFLSAATVGRPLFASDATTKDGRFVLRVHDGGRYFLKARSVYGGGPPTAGETIGDYGEKEPLSVTVARGERLTGVVIKVRKFPGRGPQAGGPQGGAKPGGKKQQQPVQGR